ncbi:MAG: hypothetical protein WC231_01230 [Dehalococcoidales bacterium]
MKKLVTLAALLEDRNAAGGKIQELRDRFQLSLSFTKQNSRDKTWASTLPGLPPAHDLCRVQKSSTAWGVQPQSLV